MKCRDCPSCHRVVRTERDRNIIKYMCWGVKEPFEINNINKDCTEYSEERSSPNTSELIEKLWEHYEDYRQGRTQSLFNICLDCKQAADKLDQLQRFIDDMYGDHYVDYLEFYINRCRELEEQVECMQDVIKRHEKKKTSNH